MATFFGEVLSASSRAVDDDEEDDSVLPDIKVCENGDSINLKDLRCVFFACNTSACAFVRASLLGLNAIGNVNGKKLLTVEKVCDEKNGLYEEFVSGLKYINTSKTLAVAYLHPKYQDVVVVLCEEKPLEEEYAPLVASKLFQHFRWNSKTSVAVLSSENLIEYKNPAVAPFNVPLLRCLFTEAALDKDVNVQRLEQPNIVSGFPAAVLTECQIRNLPAIAFICYEATSDSYSVQEILSVLKKWPFNQYRFNEKLDRPVFPVQKDLGNLYT